LEEFLYPSGWRKGEVYQPHIQLLDESDNVRQGFVNPAEFVKLHDNLPSYLKPIIEFLYLTGMRSGASKKLEHKHIDLEAKVIRLPIELSKNKKGLTIPLSGRLLLLVESAWNNRSLECPYLFHHKGEPIGDFRKAFDAACTLLASKEYCLTIFVDLPFGISFELVSKRPFL
jgi:integrase